ncbi:glycoside hydrolase family 88 protein [Butyrivibrio fibrisolvens]|uniref:glycoside hydrolase family 88 protein n=1 Tax=Butyrivibrio fibrisolvens TaxID=831 RepID=UPI00041334CE|nr:glycoside hydrolase family 88 protein [Butyrivibrio fibrisolvens]
MDSKALEYAKEISLKIKEKELKVAGRTLNKIPYTAVDGVFDDWTSKNLCWWTNGFWGGMMWQLYGATKEDIYKKRAMELEDKLDGNLMNYNGMDHDCGFKWLTTSHASMLLTDNKESRNRLLLSAANLAGRFNPAGFIRAWNDDKGDNAGWAIIDCLMNLPLLYIASELTGDPRFKKIAMIHADTAIKHFVREDGSARHIVIFDPETGDFLDEPGGQGYGKGSVWTRGQSWALYGFTMSFLHTGQKRYLETAVRCADFFAKNTPQNGRIPVDFRQPAEPDYTDSCAASIGASGLLLLARTLRNEGKDIIDGAESVADRYEETALRILHYLTDNDSDFDPETDNILRSCTAAYHDKEHEFPIIYGDYYLIEAIFRITGEETYIW